MINNKLFLAVIDNPYSSEVDFDYTACDTQDLAVNYLVNEAIKYEKEQRCEEEIFINDCCFSREEAFIVLKESLEKYHSALCNGIYYRIVPTVYLKEAQA